MAVMKTTREVRGVGLAIPRPDGPAKVTGQTQYVADIKPTGMLYAKLLRGPHAHARIVRIDTTRARALQGVRAIFTAGDIPELKRKALAIAEEACDLIDVEYEILPAAVDPLLSTPVASPRPR
jgi:CO/xanthine dehydrogenase Mo-binding subunit